MSKGKLALVVFLAVLAVSAGVGYSYYAATGGNGLTRAVFHYLIRNLPDKQYSWRDFTDQGAARRISGFYSGGDKDSFSMWTLSGLKKFYTIQGTSIYMHEDVCSAVQELNENPETAGSKIRAPQQITPDILDWEKLMRKEYFVTVKRLDGETNSNLVDKVWSYSGKYKIINQLDIDACN